MLRLWCLNVGQGDSTIVEYEGPDGRHFGLIDSNHTGSGEPRALTKLVELGAKELSFIALSHPHADHYRGLSKVLETFRGKVSTFYSYPLGSDILDRDRLTKIATLYQKAVEATDSKVAHARATEFVRILVDVERDIGLQNWWQLSGPKNQVFPVGFSGVEIHALLPLARMKGDYFRMIKDGDHSVAQEAPSLNNLSVAFEIRYGGCEVVIGGDGPHLEWIEHERQLARGGAGLNSTVVRLPHHGSKADNRARVLKHLFREHGDKFAVISADGQRHPDEETYARLESEEILPYCTNLARQCGAKIHAMIRVPEVTKVLERWLNTYADDVERASQPCQGDIIIEIDRNGGLKITPQLNNVCPYRGLLKSLFPGKIH